MKSTFNICFYAKKDKQKANGAYPLFARITVDGVASRFNTKLDVLPSIWDGKMGKATGRTSEASRINRMLDDINASLNRLYKEVWIGLGGTQSAVYATEVSAEEYLCYTTEETEKLELTRLTEKLGGNIELAIKQLAESKRQENK